MQFKANKNQQLLNRIKFLLFYGVPNIIRDAHNQKSLELLGKHKDKSVQKNNTKFTSTFVVN